MDELKKVSILANFKHDGTAYYAGEIRMLPTQLAELFCGYGWAAADGFSTGENPPADITLDVHDVVISHTGDRING